MTTTSTMLLSVAVFWRVKRRMTSVVEIRDATNTNVLAVRKIGHTAEPQKVVMKYVACARTVREALVLAVGTERASFGG